MLQAYLSDCESIKMGYMVRYLSKDAYRHKLIAMETLTVKELSNLYNFYTSNALSCLKLVLDGCTELVGDSEYVLNKPGYSNSMKVFSIPEEEDDDEEEESDEGESEEGSGDEEECG